MKTLVVFLLTFCCFIILADHCRADIQCTTFKVLATTEENAIILRIDSDLPDNTRLIVTVSRNYEEKNNTERYALEYYSAINERLVEWREPRRISVDHDKWRNDLQAKMNEYASLGMWNGLANINDTISIRVSVPPYRQPNPSFGKNNQELTGNMVIIKKTLGGETRSIEWEKNLLWPLDGPFPKATRVAPESLKVGKTYRVETTQSSIPLMLEPNPENVSKALAKAQTLKGTFTIEIRETESVDSILWYRIQAIELSGEVLASGWINSLALIGHNLSVVEK